MRKIIFVFLLLISATVYSQDSTYFKLYYNDNLQIQKELQKISDSLQAIDANVKRIEGALGYIQLKYGQDTTNSQYKIDADALINSFEDMKKTIQQLNIDYIKLQGYKEYNELLLTRETDKFKIK